MIGAYYKLATLPEEVRAANKIRSKKRLDCICFTDMVAGGYKGLTNFVNSKEQLFFYKEDCRDFVNTDSKRLAEWRLTAQSLNLSSIYIDDLDYPEIGYGYPNPNRLRSNDKENPLFEFRNDCYLFIINKDYTEIELLIIPDGRNLISSYYQNMIDGGFDDEIRELRKQAKGFYKYDGLSL
tara:strand:- start:2480 stop:3022 length:543 start_codon:yes stop_codon:yes gene_type:complete